MSDQAAAGTEYETTETIRKTLESVDDVNQATREFNAALNDIYDDDGAPTVQVAIVEIPDDKSSTDTDCDIRTDGGTRTSRQRSRQRTLAETQTAGFGLANGKVVDLLTLRFDDDAPAITVRHDRVDHPDSVDDRDPETTTVDSVTVTPTDRDGERKVEIGTRHGEDRVRIDYHDNAPRAYVRHERNVDGWVEQAAWELHPATGITQTSGEPATDGGREQSVTDAVYAALDQHADDTGNADVGAVVTTVLDETDHDLGTATSALRELYYTGQIYQPNATTIRRTKPSCEQEADSA